ncbi:MAG TPA: hypothetical protein VM492_16090 [Sumerlaeia bacterium]|nr:hypothetical protein [Sumerlaeia bacterium]
MKPLKTIRRKGRAVSLAQRRPIGARLAPFLCALVALACSRYAPPAGRPLEDPDLTQACRSAFLETYPHTFKMVQRIVLTARGRQYDFIGYLLLHRGEGFRALAAGDMGGKLFEFAAHGKNRRILLKPKHMPSRPLLDGVFGDIRHLFDPEVGSDAQWIRTDEGDMALVQRPGAGVREYAFDAETRNLVRSREMRDGRVIREATHERYRLFPGWDRPLPSRILLKNRRWRYELEIHLLHLYPDAEVPARVLNPRDDDN